MIKMQYYPVESNVMHFDADRKDSASLLSRNASVYCLDTT